MKEKKDKPDPKTKPLKISTDVHKKLKIYSAQIEQGMTEVAERAILNEIDQNTVAKRINQIFKDHNNK